MQKKALIIIDMVKDYFKPDKKYPVTEHAKKIIPSINRLIGVFREKKFPVIFSTDAFQADDFLFKGKMHPHAIKGTPGAEVIDDLDMAPSDLWLPKPRFSAFFNTGLDEMLRKQNVSSCAVAGIATHFCVLTTAMDAVCHDFETVILEDCAASSSKEAHVQCLELYRKNPLYPLLRILTSDELISQM